MVWGVLCHRGYSAVPREKATKDYKSHGTHVAGIVAAPGYGVAKSVLVVPVKVFGRSRARSTSADIIEAINFVIARKTRHRRPTVLSMSFGSRSSGFYAGERALAKARQVSLVGRVGGGGGCTDWCVRTRHTCDSSGAVCSACVWEGGRLATSVCRLRHDRMGQGPTEPHAGRSTFLLSSGGAGGAGITEWPLVRGPVLPSTGFPAGR